jgi:hypothetical protein
MCSACASRETQPREPASVTQNSFTIGPGTIYSDRRSLGRALAVEHDLARRCHWLLSSAVGRPQSGRGATHTTAPRKTTSLEGAGVPVHVVSERPTGTTMPDRKTLLAEALAIPASDGNDYQDASAFEAEAAPVRGGWARLAGVGGLEPPSSDPKSEVLPLDDTPWASHSLRGPAPYPLTGFGSRHPGRTTPVRPTPSSSQSAPHCVATTQCKVIGRTVRRVVCCAFAVSVRAVAV